MTWSLAPYRPLLADHDALLAPVRWPRKVI